MAETASKAPTTAGKRDKAGTAPIARVAGEKRTVFMAPVGMVREALQKISGMGRNRSLPITTHVLMVRTGTTLRLVATNLDQEMEATVEVGGTGQATATADLRKLIEILRSLPSDKVCTFKSDGVRSTLTCNKSNFTLSSLAPEDFPRFAEPAYGNPARLKQGMLASMIQQVSYAMAHQDVRYYLNGLYLEAQGQALYAVATDGHRLAFTEAQVEETLEQRSLILPDAVVNELSRLLAPSDDEEVELRLSDNALCMTLGNLRLMTKLVDGKFPDYRRVLPKRSAMSACVTFDRQALIQALQRAALMVPEKHQGIQLVFNKGEVCITVKGSQESSEEVLEIDYTGPTLTMGVNVKYLIEAVDSIPAKVVTLGLRGETDSIMLIDDGNEAFSAVVMPMRV